MFRLRTLGLAFLVQVCCVEMLAAQGNTAGSGRFILQGGHVIDPKNRIDAVMDVAIQAKKILLVAPHIAVTAADTVIDVQGLYVTPGIIDMHVHVFYGTDAGSYIANGETAVAPDAFSFRAGVTTMVDAGSAGWRNFRQFKSQTIDRSQTRILAFLNIVGSGMYGRFEEQDVDDMNPVMAANMATRLYPNLIVGFKSAHYWGDFTSVDHAVEAGNLAHIPVIVDFGEHKPTNSIEELFFKHLRPGDIFTHTYAGTESERQTVVDSASMVLKPFVLAAQKRGIVFDVGHGGGAFFFRQAIPAIKQGFIADVISTDLHTASMNGGMKDMANTMSKFLAMGLTLPDVILRSTWNPANVIHHPELGSLTVGSDADVAVFRLEKGSFGFLDTKGFRLKGKEKLVAELTLRAGKVVWDLDGIAARDWDTQMKKP